MIINSVSYDSTTLSQALYILYSQSLNNKEYYDADETCFLKSSNNLQFLFSSANTELSKAACWFQANKLTLNVSKTKYLLFRNKHMPFDDHVFKLNIGEEKIERIGNNCREKYFKFVGVRFDEFLTRDFQDFKCYICTEKY